MREREEDKMREEGIHKIEVHVAGICLKNEEGRFKILIGKRTRSRQLFPNCWECGGGQVHRGENFVTALKRQMKGEFGIDVVVECPIGVYEIKTNNTIIPGLRFICRPKDNQQEIVVRKELVEYKWIDESEIDIYEFIPGLKEDLKRALSLYKKILNRSE
ncbi:MAG: NUDIX domain-containing protein [Thaumarchaeota archaeon]|nr:NUDIX domain-containing protein [Nitrososphaerota archaeon]